MKFRNPMKRRNPKIVAIVQARMGSTRLPGKVLMPIGDRPMLRHVVERLEAVKELDRIVVATSTEKEDGEIAHYVHKVLEIDVAQVDDPNDVLGRYVAVAAANQATTILRVTADCPLIDPWIVAEVLAAYDRGADYCSNVWPERTFPDGLDVEVFSAATLRKLHRACLAADEREHVTIRVHRQPAAFGIIRNVSYTEDLSALRWTVDTLEDLEFVREVYRRLGPKTVFPWTEVLGLGQFAYRRVA